MLKDFGKTAIIAGSHRISFSEMLLRVDLFRQVGPVAAGGKCIILSENREGWVYALYGIWRNRGVAVPVDATSTVHDVAYILNDCQPACIWVSRNKLALAKAAMIEANVSLPLYVIDDHERVDLSDCGQCLQPTPFFPQNDHSDPGFAEFSSIFLQNDLPNPVLRNCHRFFRKMGPGCREGLFIH